MAVAAPVAGPSIAPWSFIAHRSPLAPKQGELYDCSTSRKGTGSVTAWPVPGARRGRRDLGGPRPGRATGLPASSGLARFRLHHDGDALADADAHGGQAVAAAPPPQLVDEGGDDAGPGAADGVAEGDG